MPDIPKYASNNAHMFYYWFFTGETTYSEEWRALLTISLQRFLTGRSDGGIVEVSSPLSPSLAPVEARKAAATVVENFLRDFYPAFNQLVLDAAWVYQCSNSRPLSPWWISFRNKQRGGKGLGAIFGESNSINSENTANTISVWPPSLAKITSVSHRVCLGFSTPWIDTLLPAQ